MAILVDDSDEKVLWVYGEVFDLAGFDSILKVCGPREEAVASVMT